jgi:hypothetical protein
MCDAERAGGRRFCRSRGGGRRRDVPTSTARPTSRGLQIGAGLGTAIVLNLSLEAAAAIGGLVYLVAAVVGWFILYETLEFAGEPEEHISHSPAEIWDTLWGGPEGCDHRAERRACVASYFFNYFGLATSMPVLVYFLLWRFDLSHRVYFELHAVSVASLTVGFVLYWFWLRKAVGPAKCLALGLLIHAVGIAAIGAAYDVGLLFAATGFLFIAAPVNLQYLYINGVVPPEKQGRLSGGIQILGAVAAALGLGLGYSL